MKKEKTNPVIEALNNTDKDILLVGTRGTGKTTTLNDAMNNNDNKFLINTTLNNEEYILLRDRNISDLYYTCLIIKKILNNIKARYSETYIENFIEFEEKINIILKQTYIMYMIDIYKIETDFITKEIYNSPEILIEQLLSLISKKIDVKDFALIIDRFDEIGGSSQRYQEFIYNKLKSYVRLIMTISDKKISGNQEKLEEFSKDNAIVELNYSKNVNAVKEILKKELGISTLNDKMDFILTDDTLYLMIEKTNGNLFDMLYAIRTLYNHIKELEVSEYDTFILNFIDNEINKSPMFTGIIVPERKLYIEPSSRRIK